MSWPAEHGPALSRSISAGVGFIPLAGDIALAVFKANSRNCKLLEEYLRVLGEEHIAAGLPNLTPEPPALPGVQHPSEVTTPHPAQSAAKKLVKDHSDQQLLAGNASASPATAPATATTGNQAAADRVAETQTADAKKKWWQVGK